MLPIRIGQQIKYYRDQQSLKIVEVNHYHGFWSGGLGRDRGNIYASCTRCNTLIRTGNITDVMEVLPFSAGHNILARLCRNCANTSWQKELDDKKYSYEEKK